MPKQVRGYRNTSSTLTDSQTLDFGQLVEHKVNLMTSSWADAETGVSVFRHFIVQIINRDKNQQMNR